jgi:type IV fimbrial biogenesis protein FimT
MKCRGFTLTELMVTVSMAGVVLALGVPSYRNVVQNNRIATQANELLTSLHLARSEAVKRGHAVSVCASSDGDHCNGLHDWTTGWIVFTEPTGANGTADGADEVLRAWPGLAGNAVLGADTPFVQYRSTGAALAPANFRLDIPDAGELGCPRDIRVTGPGRPVLSTTNC